MMEIFNRTGRVRNFSLFFGVAIFLSIGSASGQEKNLSDLSDTEIAEAFQDIVWGRELTPFEGSLITWHRQTIEVEPIFRETKLALYKSNVEPYLKDVAKIISDNTDFEYKIIDGEKNSSTARGFIIYGDKKEIIQLSNQLFSLLNFTKWREIFNYQARNNLPYCTVTLIGNNRNEAIVFVATVEEGSFSKSCVYEEIFQSTGLINDTLYDVPSIIGRNNQLIHPTELDKLMLRLITKLKLHKGGPATVSDIAVTVHDLR